MRQIFPWVYFSCFSASLWWLKFFSPFATPDLNKQVWGLFLILGLFTLPYLWMLRRNAAPSHGVSAAFALVFACVLTPSYLETDQFRYIWDGLLASLGINPFRYAPAGISWRAEHFWAMQINHPELHTIYPPFAQLAFLLAAYLNPFFWGKELGSGLPPTIFGVGSFFAAEFGLKLTLGLSLGVTVAFLRKQRWDLLLFHPLFLFHVVGNSHVDALMLPGLALFFSGVRRHRQTVAWVGWSAAVLAKWLPLIFLPFLLTRQALQRGWISALGSAALALGVIAGVCLLFASGSEGHFLTSTVVYAQNWSFFGYLHRWIADGLALFNWSAQPMQDAKGVGALLWLASAVAVYGAHLRAKLSLRLAMTLLLLFALVVKPTLHPWYFITLLFLGLPHIRALPVLWVWPLLALTSHAFYLEWEDPFWIRNGVYALVTLILLRDLRRIFRPGRSGSCLLRRGCAISSIRRRTKAVSYGFGHEEEK